MDHRRREVATSRPHYTPDHGADKPGSAGTLQRDALVAPQAHYPAPALDDSPEADAAEIARTARLFLARSPVVGVRAFDVPTSRGGTIQPGGGFLRVWEGYYDDADTLAGDVARLDAGGAAGVCLSLNALDPLTLYRAPNAIAPAGSKGRDGVVSFSAPDVRRRLWLPVDCDALTTDPDGGWRKRPGGVSASEEEAARQFAAVERIAAELRARFGFPPFVLAASGNGGHALFPVDLPAADDGLTKRALAGLAVLADGLGIGWETGTDLDAGVHDAPRPWRLYGTAVRKGSTGGGARPNRRSRIVSAPCDLSTLDGPRGLATVEPDALEALAALAAEPERKTYPSSDVPARSSAPARHADDDLTDAEIAAVLDFIPKPRDYNGWFPIIGAVYAACGFDAPRAASLLEAWSPEGDGPNSYARKIEAGAGAIYTSAGPGPLIDMAKAHGHSGHARERRPVDRRRQSSGLSSRPFAPPVDEVDADPQGAGVGAPGGEKSFLATKGNGLGEKAFDPFATALEWSRNPPPPTEWIVPGLFPVGGTVLLSGPPKGAGKTTLVTAAVAAALRGGLFLGRKTARTPVVYLSEQPQGQFQTEYLRPAGCEASPDLHIAEAWRLAAMSWPETVELAARKVEETGARLVVVDTFARFAKLGPDAENDAGAVTAALEPLQGLAAEYGVCVVLIHHDRKGGGQIYDAGRGSSALAGNVDVLMSLRPDHNKGATVRRIEAEGRYADLTRELYIDRTEDGTYRPLGTAANVVGQTARDLLFYVLPLSEADAVPLDAKDGDTLWERVQEAAGVADVKPPSKRTLRRVLESAVEVGQVEQAGEGVKGDPFRFFRTAPLPADVAPSPALPSPEMLSRQPQTPSGEKETEPPRLFDAAADEDLDAVLAPVGITTGDGDEVDRVPILARFLGSRGAGAEEIRRAIGDEAADVWRKEWTGRPSASPPDARRDVPPASPRPE